MDKPDKIRLLESLGVDCWWSERLKEWMCHPPGNLRLRTRAAKFNGETETWWRLWLLEEMERRGLWWKLFRRSIVPLEDKGVPSMPRAACYFAKLSNEALMRAALAVLEESHEKP